MTPQPAPPAVSSVLPMLRGELPESIAWLEDDLRGLVCPTAFLRSQRVEKGVAPTSAPLGSTRAWGTVPDVPVDAPWAPAEHLDTLRRQWTESPYDGSSFYFQLDLGEIPACVRAHLPMHCPSVGVVWVFVDLSEDWEGVAYFDPRPSQSIAWHARRTGEVVPMAQWSVADTLPFATESTLPAVARVWDEMGDVYDDWMQAHYCAPSDIQIGGWAKPIQGDADEAQETFVCALTNLSFGDSGAVYLHHSEDKGFFVLVQTC